LDYPFQLQELVDLATKLEAEFEAANEDVVDEEHRMIDHAGLLAALDTWGAGDVDDSPDYVNSVSGVVIRCVYEGRRTVAVGSDASTEQCIGAVLDLEEWLPPVDVDGYREDDWRNIRDGQRVEPVRFPFEA
jgi:hypothetical protein